MSCLENNMTALKTQFPQLIRILEETDVGQYELFPTKSGDLTIRAEGVFIHSRHYPEKEAEKLIDREIDDSTNFCFFYGFGLGYHIEAFHRKYPDTLFAVIEPDKKLFLQALSCRDFSALFQSGMMNLLLGTEPDAVTVLLDQIKTTRIQSCLLRPLYLSNKEYYDQLDKKVRDYIAKKEINANTHHRFNRLWISNISRNAPLLSRAAGIYNLYGRFTGKAALLVAAGPGLNGILPVLEQLREHLLIVCVDTALKACLAVGVEPDFTVLTDPQY
jgi:hypothetical protein